jgi:hypothetical protein
MAAQLETPGRLPLIGAAVWDGAEMAASTDWIFPLTDAAIAEIEAAQLDDAVPKMTPEHWRAIELMAEIAEEVAFETTQEPGEIQLLNSHLTFHARTAYEDHPEPERRRLLYRLWLSMANSRPLPESFAVLFRDVRPGAVRGGILPASN